MIILCGMTAASAKAVMVITSQHVTLSYHRAVRQELIQGSVSVTELEKDLNAKIHAQYRNSDAGHPWN